MSANEVMSTSLKTTGMSLLYIINRRGPNVDPCHVHVFLILSDLRLLNCHLQRWKLYLLQSIAKI